MLRSDKESGINALCVLGQSFYAEGNLPGQFIPDIARSSWEQLYQQERGQIFSLYYDEEPVGTLGCVVYPDPYDGELVAAEMFWWVMPAARGHGLRLLSAYESYCASRNVKRNSMIHLTSKEATPLSRLYERRGYKNTETFYWRTMSV